MKVFGEVLNVTNKSEFPNLHYKRTFCYFRKEIYEMMIKNDENDFFDLDGFCRKHLSNDREIMKQMTDAAIIELEEMGWTCKICYGSSGLYIFSGDPPPSCYPDEF
jgi:hypothetical protein